MRKAVVTTDDDGDVEIVPGMVLYSGSDSVWQVIAVSRDDTYNGTGKIYCEQLDVVENPDGADYLVSSGHKRDLYHHVFPNVHFID